MNVVGAGTAAAPRIGDGARKQPEGHPHDRLVDLHAAMRRLAAEHRELCRAAAPDATRLGGVRWRIADVGRSRMALLTNTVFPLLDRRCRGAERAMAMALAAGTDAYRREVSNYVSIWSTTAILAGWPTYRREAEAFRRMVATRLAAERAALLPPLRRFGQPNPAAGATVE